MHYQAVVRVVDYLDLDSRLWAQMINLGVANSRVEAGLCTHSRRPSLEVIAVVTLPSLVRLMLGTAVSQISVESSKDMWTC
jgi:hypothetical protein